MAEDGKKNKSLLRTALIASPFVGAVGHTIYKGVRENTGDQKGKIKVPSMREVLRHSKISQLQHEVSQSVKVDFLEDLTRKGLNKDTTIAQKLRTSWDQAIRDTRAFDLSKLPREMHSLESVPLHETIETIGRFAQNTSKLNHEIFSRFRRNWQAMSRSSGQILNYKPISGLKFPTLESLYGKSMESKIEKALTEIAGDSLHTQFFSSPGYAERGLGIFDVQMSIKGLPLKFSMPTIDPTGQFLVEGTTQSSRRIATAVGVLDPLTGSLTKMNRNEYFLEELKRSIVPDIQSGRLKSQSAIKSAISSLYEQVYSTLESVPNIDPSKVGPGAQKYQEVRSSAMQLLVANKDRKLSGNEFSPAFRKASTEEAISAIKQHGLYAGTGSHVGEGLVQTMDITQDHLFPEAVDWARKPESAIRRFDLTSESAAKVGGTSPTFRTMYVKQELIDQWKKDNDSVSRMLFGEGHALGRASLSNDLAFQWAQDIHLKTMPDMEFDDFQKALTEGKFKPGDIIGWDHSGEAVEMSQDMRILSAQANRTVGKGDFVTLSVINERRLLDNEKFHGDFKALLSLQKDMDFNNTAKRLANRSQLFKDIDTIVSMDELKKDSGKFAKQIWTGIADVAARDQWMKPDSSMGSHWEAYQNWLKNWAEKNEVLSDIKTDPTEWSEMLRSQATTGKGWSNEEFVRSAMGLAREANMNPEDVAAIFGAAPVVLKEGITEKLLQENFGAEQSKAILSEMNRGVAFGKSQVTWGGPSELRGAGRRGSLEPRSFEVFQGSSFKDFGKDITQDLTQRIYLGDPTAYKTSQGLTKTLESMTGKIKPGQSDKILNIDDIVGPDLHNKVQRFIEEGGGWLRAGKDIPDVFVPNISEMESLAPIEIASGKKVFGDVSNLFHNIASEAAAMHSSLSPVSSQEVKAGYETIMRDIHKIAAPAGKGQGAWLRSKVPGSQFLQGVDEPRVRGVAPLRPTEVGLPKRFADKMFEEMAALNIYNSEQLGNMRSRFFAGESIGGLIGRHPTFAEHSIQQVMFKMVQGDQPHISLPEYKVNVGGNLLNLGPMLGMAGDKDADLYSAMLVSPDIEQKISKNLLSEDSQYLHNYAKYQVRYQMLKAGKSVGSTEVTTMENMIGGARKLAVVPEWVPKLSLQMTDSRRAVRQFGQGAAAADAEMLLTWLEQTPISSKHLSVKEAAEGKLGTMMAQLSASFEAGDVKLAREVVDRITQNNATANQLLRGSIQLSETEANAIGDLYGIKNFDRNLGGLNLDTALETIMSSRKQYAESGLERQAELLSAKGPPIRTKEIPLLSQLVSSGEAATSGRFDSELLESIMRTKGTIGHLGEVLMQNKKTVGFGLAATLALGSVLSNPQKSIGPGSAYIPPEGLIKRANSAGSQLQENDINPTPNRTVGQPSAPNLVNTNSVARVSMNQGRNMTIRGTLPAGSTNRSIGNLARYAGSGSNGISVNLRDNRSPIDRFSKG